MTTAIAEIERLDRFLRLYGSGNGTLSRGIGTGSASVNVRYHMRYYKEDELNENILQGDSRVIISPTEINTEQWPQPMSSQDVGDLRVPRRDDKFVPVDGRTKNVQSCEALYLDNILVKLIIQVRGR